MGAEDSFIGDESSILGGAIGVELINPKIMFFLSGSN
jgi:hypothetical protein